MEINMFIELLLVGVLVWKIVTDELHRKEVKELEDRLMARNFDEYKYFEKKFPKDVDIVHKAQKQSILTEQPIDAEEDIAVKKFVSGLEEDWSTEAIDKTNLPEIINEPKINREEDSQG
jgi:hypothetical protein